MTQKSPSVQLHGPGTSLATEHKSFNDLWEKLRDLLLTHYTDMEPEAQRGKRTSMTMHTELGSVWLSFWPLPGLPSDCWKRMLQTSGLSPSHRGKGRGVTQLSQQTWITSGLSALLQSCIWHRKPRFPFSAPWPALLESRGPWLGRLGHGGATSTQD